MAVFFQLISIFQSILGLAEPFLQICLSFVCIKYLRSK